MRAAVLPREIADGIQLTVIAITLRSDRRLDYPPQQESLTTSIVNAWAASLIPSEIVR
jgi:hypothetical protein